MNFDPSTSLRVKFIQPVNGSDRYYLPTILVKLQKSERLPANTNSTLISHVQAIALPTNYFGILHK
ncbi:hypothetical protein [Dendronalium sp. ChiSLP03b]|uniref:hypothetical protein n=1 Tax=Dendronalium sp. ChiSLP03b TaxID=3075381 RepID=UPI002AD3F88A|nr:hypothetical protein [Dendronalium sp. ChiSLP03b]MDZ8206567.1 hypothetical protein [Dendronalium sp. ChiSLP03b]